MFISFSIIHRQPYILCIMRNFLKLPKLFSTYAFVYENVWWKGMMKIQEIKGSFLLGPPILWCVFPSVSYISSHTFHESWKALSNYQKYFWYIYIYIYIYICICIYIFVVKCEWFLNKSEKRTKILN